MISMDIYKDLAKHCANLLNSEGYDVINTDEEAVLKQFLTIKKHRVAKTRRTVHEAFSSVPEELKEGYKFLKTKIVNGDDIWPHQSRKITNNDFKDGMLLHFGIHHFHLGLIQDVKHSRLIQGTETLLFAVVTDTDFYAIGFFHHGDWCKQDLLNIINRNWPFLIETCKVKGINGSNPIGLAVNYTDDDLKTLQKNNINSFIQLDDGSISLGGGLGVATDGSSVEVMQQINKLKRKIGEYETMIKNHSASEDNKDYHLEFKYNRDVIEIIDADLVLMKLETDNILSLFLEI